MTTKGKEPEATRFVRSGILKYDSHGLYFHGSWRVFTDKDGKWVGLDCSERGFTHMSHRLDLLLEKIGVSDS